MNNSQSTLALGQAPHDIGRRIVLSGLLGAYAASLIPWALAQPVANAEQGAFLGVSVILVGRQMLDTAHAKRLYEALVAADAGFPAAAQALHKVLTDEKSPLAPVAQNIARAWFMGIVGSGEKALNAQIVQDFLKPLPMPTALTVAGPKNQAEEPTMADNLSADFVVIGSGIIGSIAAHKLAKVGASVLILEAGPRIGRDEIVARRSDWMSPYPSVDSAPHPIYQPKDIRMVGGTTWH